MNSEDKIDNLISQLIMLTDQERIQFEKRLEELSKKIHE